MNDLYPFEGHRLDLGGGINYHYLDEGSGDPIVMLHGNPTWSFYYRRLVSALSPGYRTIVPDHVGCGLSDKPDDRQYDYTLTRRVSDLETLVEHLNLDRGITLVLHDWGGMIGMAYAARHPEKIERLIILNTAAFHLPTTKKLPWMLRACRMGLLGAPLVQGLNAFGRVSNRLCCTQHPMPPEVRRAYLAPYDSWKHRIAVLRFVQDIPLRPGDRGYDLVTEVENGLDRFADIPMLICWGGKDFVFDHHFLEEWVRRFPDAELHLFPAAGHYVLEDAHDEIIPLVEQFLTVHSVESPLYD